MVLRHSPCGSWGGAEDAALKEALVPLLVLTQPEKSEPLPKEQSLRSAATLWLMKHFRPDGLCPAQRLPCTALPLAAPCPLPGLPGQMAPTRLILSAQQLKPIMRARSGQGAQLTGQTGNAEDAVQWWRQTQG